MQTLVEHGCGLDVHQATVVACVLHVRQDGKVQKQLRTFGATTFTGFLDYFSDVDRSIYAQSLDKPTRLTEKRNPRRRDSTLQGYLLIINFKFKIGI